MCYLSPSGDMKSFTKNMALLLASTAHYHGGAAKFPISEATVTSTLEMKVCPFSLLVQHAKCNFLLAICMRSRTLTEVPFC